MQDAKARSDGPDPGRGEGKPPPSDAKEDPPARHERSPRGTKRFSETREAWRPRSSFFQVLVIYTHMCRKWFLSVGYVLCFQWLDVSC